MTMTKEATLALRKPFPPESVGTLPKPYKKDSPKGECSDCGGWHGLPAVHLDFVGHAAVTDRLLTVDPEWFWQPMALDQYGSPQCDRDGNLWIKLTICGVTRLGVGDGANMKERIGDALRNAAMRFGVGLDLWAKENLVEFAQAARTPPESANPNSQPSAAPAADPPADDLITALEDRVAGEMTTNVRGRMFAELAKHGITDPDRQRAGMSKALGREVTSRADLSDEDMRTVIASLASVPVKT